MERPELLITLIRFLLHLELILFLISFNCQETLSNSLCIYQSINYWFIYLLLYVLQQYAAVEWVDGASNVHPAT